MEIEIGEVNYDLDGRLVLSYSEKKKEKVNKKEEGRQEGRRGAFEKGWPAGRPSVKVFETHAP